MTNPHDAPTNDREATLARIARETMGVQTLQPRHRDALDFHDLAVGSIRQALERAYEAGRLSSPPTRTKCPACNREIEIRPL